MKLFEQFGEQFGNIFVRRLEDIKNNDNNKVIFKAGNKNGKDLQLECLSQLLFLSRTHASVGSNPGLAGRSAYVLEQDVKL